MAERITKQYNRIRKLESMIRYHTSGSCKCRGPHECLSKLHRLIPLEPRPTLNQAYKRERQRKENK
jgi:hypothetical protein